MRTNTTEPEGPGICCEPIGTDACEDTDTSCDNGCYASADGWGHTFISVLRRSTHVICGDRVDVRIVGSYLPVPTSRPVKSLRRVTRYWLGSKMRTSSWKSTLMTWSHWNTQTASGLVTLHQAVKSSGHVEADGCPLTSFARRWICVATSSDAMCSTAHELLQLRTILEHLGFRVQHHLLQRLGGLAGIAQRAGLGKVKALAEKSQWLQDVAREEGWQIKSIALKTSKAGTRWNAVRCTWERERVVYHDWFFWNATWLILLTWDRGVIAVVWILESVGCANVVMAYATGSVLVSSPIDSCCLGASQAKSRCKKFCQASSHECSDSWAACCVLHMFQKFTDLCIHSLSV